MWMICFNCDGWYEDEDLTFDTWGAARGRLDRMAEELDGWDRAEILWATDKDGEQVLIANGEHQALVARVVREDNEA